MPTAQTPGQQVRTSRREPYPVTTMIRARELRDAGWYPTAIRRILTSEGHGSPSLFTIQTWTNQRYLADHTRRQRLAGSQRVANGGSFRLCGSTEQYQQAFMERLRAEGVSFKAIAQVCRVVLDVELTDEQVRYKLRDVMRVEQEGQDRARLTE